ncbi:probable serine/threonine-protein kinase SIS8 [Rutidosis leptorrhynchoides]|uniref:probable serine/threonine-protein kinase SIS8 n=1 Tax=Rutidosis leptorrhynchoides TaxID=125765 RepID=UPI003A99987C
MKSLLKKLSIKPNSNQSSSKSDSSSQSGITGWLNSVTNKKSLRPTSSSNLKSIEGFDSVTSSQLDSGFGNSRDPEVEEEYQIQLALELSAIEDPEAVQIEAVKQISLGSCDLVNSDLVNTPAEIVSYRYWVGSLKIGLAYHRALLFKVLADSVGIPCRLVKGKQHTGSNNDALNFIKLCDGREYTVDLMSEPGTLVPSNISPAKRSNASYDESFVSSPLSHDEDSSLLASPMSGPTSSSVDNMEDNNEIVQYTLSSCVARPTKDDLEPKKSLPSLHQKVHKEKRGSSYYTHARSPSWTEGISSPDVRKSKVKDVTQYIMEAAKENPLLAQKLHDVLLESGVVAPPDLFTEVYEEELPTKTSDGQSQISQPRFLPPLSYPQRPEANSVQYIRSVPAAAAAAAAVASSMVVAVARTMTDQNIQLQVRAAATVTAAVVVATTTASVVKQYEMSGVSHNENNFNNLDCPKRDDYDSEEQYRIYEEGERISDRSMGNESALSEVSLEDVADCEIAWEDMRLGERIGLGSYGEVYRGDLHGTDVAVKKFVDQEITIESLEEFRSEVRIMKRVRHPNVVLFMGAVTRAPHLSIVTEFLPRGSLYKLLRRPNNQLGYRRRLRMALDTARGMNYLHNCSPVIVHRDLKSPNLLVDKNWAVKVCDFGLSRMKNSTFLSSRSTAGTAEWMAPEVLRNEPSDEKCDVYSFGVVLWELCTMKQPWGGMNAMQVVGAVGFQHRRLDIPNDMDPTIADIITRCWQTDPKLRPTFAEIMAALKPKLNSSCKTVQE